MDIQFTLSNQYSERLILNCKGQDVIVRIRTVGTPNTQEAIDQKFEEVKAKLKAHCEKLRE